MTRGILNRIRLYFCPDCGALVSCTRKTRRHPDRVCQPGKCVDYVRCRLRHVYHNMEVVRDILVDDKKKGRFYKKYDLHRTKCGKCLLLDIKYAAARSR